MHIRVKITNNGPAAEGVETVEGRRWIAPGRSREVTIAEEIAPRVARIKSLSVEEVHDETLDSEVVALDNHNPDPLDHDGRPGGSLPADPPSLTGKNKTQLLEIAEAEGVEIEEGSTNADIMSAIELAREEATKA